MLKLERRVVQGFPKTFDVLMTESQMALIPTKILDFGVGEYVSLC